LEKTDRDYSQPSPSNRLLKDSFKITPHFEYRYIPSGWVAKARYIQIILSFQAVPAGRHNPQNGELDFSLPLNPATVLTVGIRDGTLGLVISCLE
jgi:hypothetical protein